MTRQRRTKAAPASAPITRLSSPASGNRVWIRSVFGRVDMVQGGLAALAFLSWLGGHFVGPVSDVAIPTWVVSGLALGLLYPRSGLLVVVLVVPYVGGAPEPGQGELLRVMPVLGAATRVGLDRLRGQRSVGAPGGAVVGLAIVAAGLFILTAFTAYLPGARAEGQVLAGLPWLLGAPVAFLAAWIVGSHDGDAGDNLLLDTVLISTTVGCAIALAAWSNISWAAAFTFTPDSYGRLAAFGFPTPTGIGLAVALPFAVAAANRRHVLAAACVLVLGLATIVATGSRGPLIGLAVGATFALAVSGRLTWRTALVGGAVAVVAGAALVAKKYGTTPDEIIAMIQGVGVGDSYRVQSWVAAVEITARNPIMGGGWRSLSRFQDFYLQGIASSHNILLNAFADGGLPLGLSFGGVLLYSIRNMWTNRRSIASYAMTAAITLLVTGIWDIPNLRSYGAVMGGLALGLVARRVPDLASAHEPAASRRATRKAGARAVTTSG